MGHYLGLIQPYREDFLTAPDEEETELMRAHYRYLEDLLERGKLVLAGPTLIEEDPIGVYIFEADSGEEARSLFENDPAVRAGIQDITRLQPMRISLMRSTLDEA